MFSEIIPRAMRRACIKPPGSLAPASSTFVHWFATSPRHKLDRKSSESGSLLKEHDVDKKMETGDGRTEYERDDSGLGRHAHRSRGRPSKHIRQSRPPPGFSLSSEYDLPETNAEASYAHQVSTDPDHQAVAVLTDPDVDVPQRRVAKAPEDHKISAPT
jgi:hypothetical protein